MGAHGMYTVALLCRVVHGLLLDRSREFFIHEVNDPAGVLMGDQDGEGELDEWHKVGEMAQRQSVRHIGLMVHQRSLANNGQMLPIRTF